MPEYRTRTVGTEPRPLLILDFDGTLADTWALVAPELVRVSGRLTARAVTRADLEALRGRPTREILAGLGATGWRLPRLVRHLRALAAREAGSIRLFAGVPALLGALRAAGISVAVISSNGEATVRAVLAANGAGPVDAFDCGVTVFGKARRFRRVMRRLGARSDRTVIVGDETRDLDAARSIGVAAIAVEWGWADPALLRRAAPGRTVATVPALAERLLAVAAVRPDGSAGE